MFTATTVLRTVLDEEMTEHLGHGEHHAAVGENGDVCGGARPETVLSDAAGGVALEVPRDRAGTFGPVVVKKRRRRLGDVDAILISSGRSSPGRFATAAP